MRKMPWVDFSIVLRENNAERRQQAIMELLQNNMPDNNDQYYIYHDQETNSFSVELDENAGEGFYRRHKGNRCQTENRRSKRSGKKKIKK